MAVQPSEVNDSEKPGKLCSDEELKEAQKELDHMKKKIGIILDSALEKAAAKKVYGSLRRQRVSPSTTAMRRTSSLKVPRPRHTMASTLLRQQMLSLPPEEPETKDVLTQTTDLPAGKPRVVWSIYKTSEAAAQTSFLVSLLQAAAVLIIAANFPILLQAIALINMRRSRSAIKRYQA
ncbi:hypothetical protein V5799_007190 [Amblyomma americanum]|uniref:Uncharacterized protein n=1 Tax=Amblyomma americanum TaxID=6943 RepID=A0AAQ4DU86_AMBAM